MLVFTTLLLVLVGAVFVLSPATLLKELMPVGSGMDNLLVWIVVILVLKDFFVTFAQSLTNPDSTIQILIHNFIKA